MNTLAWILTTIAVALIAWIAGFEQCWWQFVVPRLRAKRDEHNERDEPTIGKHMISYPLPPVPDSLSRNMVPESPNGGPRRYRTDPNSRN